MASDILGLFTTPEQYQLAQQQAQQAQAIQYANLDPMARANYGTFRAGQQLGGAIGGALGGQDPQLQLIARRQQLLGQLDRSDPMSYRRVAKMASDAGDQQLAQGIAEAGMKAESELALTQQRTAEKMTSEQRNALAYADSVAPRGSIEHNEAFQSRFDLLTLKSEKTNKPFEFEAREARVQDLKASLRVLESQPAPNKEAIQRLKDSIQAIEGVPKAEQRISFGTEAERKSKTMYGKPYADLTPEQSGLVDAAVEKSEREKAKSGATVVSSGVEKFKDIPDLRAKIVSVVDPFRKAVNATDMALESLNLSITENNFSGFNAARVQLAKALSGGDLSQKEIAAAGGDPSILGGLIDITSTAFTGTPSFDTQNKIKNTINAIRKVALKKGRDEIGSQRNIAVRSGFNEDDFNAASDIPEFRPRNKKPPAGVKPFDADKEKRYQEFKARQSGATQ